MTNLPDDIYEKILQKSAEGDELVQADLYAEALELYWAAWDLLPEPQTDWEAATWLLAAIGDTNFLGGDYEAGRENLAFAMHCPDAIGNPFLHLRLGQCQLEMGDEERAADELARAYMAEGAKIFEDEPPKYFAFLKTRMEPPPHGWE